MSNAASSSSSASSSSLRREKTPDSVPASRSRDSESPDLRRSDQGRASGGAALALAVDRNPALIRAVETVAASFGVAGLEAHVADAQAFLTRESRSFDVVFLDPPFGSDPWTWLLPRAMVLLSPGSFVFA